MNNASMQCTHMQKYWKEYCNPRLLHSNFLSKMNFVCRKSCTKHHRHFFSFFNQQIANRWAVICNRTTKKLQLLTTRSHICIVNVFIPFNFNRIKYSSLHRCPLSVAQSMISNTGLKRQQAFYGRNAYKIFRKKGEECNKCGMYSACYSVPQ